MGDDLIIRVVKALMVLVNSLLHQSSIGGSSHALSFLLFIMDAPVEPASTFLLLLLSSWMLSVSDDLDSDDAELSLSSTFEMRLLMVRKSDCMVTSLIKLLSSSSVFYRFNSRTAFFCAGVSCLKSG